MIKNMLQSTVRYKIIQAIELFLNQPDSKKIACQILDAIRQEFLNNIFALDSVVFGGIVEDARSLLLCGEIDSLHALRDELMGQIPSRNSYALKYNFVELLGQESYETYRKLTKLLQIISQRIDVSMTSREEIENYEDLRESLYVSCYEKMQVCTLADLLVAQGCHILLLLPDNGAMYFDIADSAFSSIYPPVYSQEAIEPHLTYVKSLLQKLEGKAALFVDIHLLPEGFVLNLR